MSRVRGERWLVLAVAVTVFFCRVSDSLADKQASASHGIESPILFVQIPVDQKVEPKGPGVDGMLRTKYGDGGRIVRLEPDGQLRVLTEAFDSACEFDVSLDAKRVLFTGKRNRGDLWNVWEMNADGSDPRQITSDFGNCRSPAYQATLYTIVSTEPWYQIMFISDAAGMMNEFGSGAATSLYSCKLDGSATRRLTMNLSDDMDPHLMPDGRVLLASWQRMDLHRGPRGRVSLFGVNTDGTDYALFCGDQGDRVKHMPTVTTDGLVVFVEDDRVEWDGSGHLASVTLRRNFYSHRRITDEENWRYHSPSPLPDATVLVSARTRAVDSTHAVYRLDPRTGDKILLFGDPKYHDMHARILAPRPQPDGRSSVVNEKYPTGKFYCLNAYLTEPAKLKHMKPGMIKSLRVIEGVPAPYDPGKKPLYFPHDSSSKSGPSKVDPIVKKRLLGVVPVEKDGSFHIEVPADTPIQLQTLDADGLALQTCGWIWAKHREPRGCIGCHEDPELTPANRFVDALKQPGMQLTLPPERRRTVGFRRDVMPIITKKCVSCHEEWTPGPIKLDEYVDRTYERILRGAPRLESADVGHDRVAPRVRVFYGVARASPLVWRILGRNTSRPWDALYAPGQEVPQCPPPGAEQLTDDEKLTFIEWIDLGAHWEGIPEAPKKQRTLDTSSHDDGDE